ncbi:MAG: imidazoleglycerol-phosphate dehydratase, partial [Bacillota bacterium]
MRCGKVTRKTRETAVEVELDLDGSGKAVIATGLPFFDHLLNAFACHGRFDLSVQATGDIQVDGHHMVEDVGLAMGLALTQALGKREGLRRWGWALLPMDEALVQVAADLGGRSFLVYR